MSEQKPKIVPRGREHPDLQALDALNYSYPGWQHDKARAECDHFEGKDCKLAIASMHRKQQIHAGDRSHPNLVALDALHCGYPGWQDDKAEAEDSHCRYPNLVKDEIETMSRKQKLFVGDRSHPDLVALDALKCNYPGWKDEKAIAERYYCKSYDITEELEGMHRKQKIHEGGRHSDPYLIKLFALKCTYPGWEKDSAKAENSYFKGMPGEDQLQILRKKQQIYAGDRSHPNLAALDALHCGYPGWQDDKAEAEDSHCRYPNLVKDEIETMSRKQKLFVGDRSHPDLVALDALKCNYPGWKDDKAKAERYYCKSFDITEELEGMRRKQHSHEGSAACPIALAGAKAGGNSVARRPAQKRQRLNVGSRMPREDSSFKCVVCLTSEKTHIFQPCGHHCVCANCSVWAMDQQKCPYCRQTITSTAEFTVARRKAHDGMIDLTK